jgi:hypothetical protein
VTQQTPVVEQAYPSRAFTALVNPIARMLLSSPLGGPLRRRYMLVHFTGRKSGRRYVVPVTVHRSAGELYILTSARWKHNFRGGADLEVTLNGRTTPMRGELIEDPETVAGVYARRIDEYGLTMAKIEIGIKIHVPRTPTVEELADATRRIGFSVIRLTPKE